jgi:hypothetical protein
MAGAGCQAIELQRIGGEADTPPQRSNNGSGLTTSYRQILAYGQDNTPLRRPPAPARQ